MSIGYLSHGVHWGDQGHQLRQCHIRHSLSYSTVSMTNDTLLSIFCSRTTKALHFCFRYCMYVISDQLKSFPLFFSASYSKIWVSFSVNREHGRNFDIHLWHNCKPSRFATWHSDLIPFYPTVTFQILIPFASRNQQMTSHPNHNSYPPAHATPEQLDAFVSQILQSRMNAMSEAFTQEWANREKGFCAENEDLRTRLQTATDQITRMQLLYVDYISHFSYY